MNNISVTPKGGTIASDLSGNQVTLTAPSLVKLHLNQSDIKSLTRNGNDLVITTKSGETLVIHNFYSPNGDSDLVLQDDQGALWWVEDPGTDGVHYVSIANTDAILGEDGNHDVLAAAVGIGAGGAALAALAALAGGGGGGGGHNNSGSNDSGSGSNDGSGSGNSGSGSNGSGGSGSNDGSGSGSGDNGSGGTGDNGGGTTTPPTGGDGGTTTPPSAVSDLVITDDVGTKQGAITNGTSTDDNTPTLSGTATAGDTINIYDGTTLLGTTTVGSDGTWSYTTSALADGQHSLTVTVSDSSGNTSTATDAVTFTVDTVAPAAATDLVVTDDVGGTQGPLTSGGVTDDNTPTLSGQAEAGTTISVYDGTTLLGTTTVGSDGTWSYTPAALSNGEHSLTVTVTDAAGNVSPATTAFDLDVLANLPPATSTLEVSDDQGTTPVQLSDGAETNDNTPVLSGETTAGAQITLYDGDTVLGTVTAGTDGQWVFVTSALDDGSHAFHAEITDTTGNVTESATITITIDTVAPDAASDLQLTNDDGSTPVTVPSGGATNDTTPVLTGTAEPGSTVTVSDGTTVLGTTTVGDDGTWSYTTPTLGDGDHSLTTTVTDPAGNTSPTSDPITFTVDTTPPAAATDLVVTDNVGDSTGPLASGATTDDNTPTLSGQAEAGTTVSVYDGTTLLGTTTVGSDGTWSYTPSELSNGDHSLTVTVTDAAGNVSPATTAFPITVDADLPPATSSLEVTDDTGSTLVILADGASTHDSTPILSGLAGAGDSIVIYNGTTEIGTATADSSGQWQFDTTTLADGTYAFKATATDAAGNTASSDTITITIDTVAPAAAGDLGLTNDEGSTAVPITSGSSTNDDTPVFSGTAEVGSTITVYDGTTVLGTTTTGSNGTWSFTTPTLTDGDHSLTATVTDAAGNSSDASTPITFTLDTQAPAAASDVQLNSDTTGVDVPITDGATNDTTPVLTGSAEAGSTVTVYDGTNVLGTTTAGTDGTWSFTTPTLSQGDHSLTTTVTDAAGNVSSASTAIPVTVDSIAPAAASDLVLSDDQSGTAVPITDGATNDTTPVLTGTAEAGSTVTVSDGTTILGSVTVASDGTWSYSIPTLSEGDHSLTTTVTDAAGNVSPASDPIALTVDTTAPDPVSNVLLENNNGTSLVDIPNGGTTNDSTPLLSGTAEAGSTISIYDTDTGTLIATTTADATTGAWNITPTTALADGTYNIGITATDAAGNASTETTISFTVDATAPAAATDLVVTDNVGDTTGPLASGATTDDSTPTLSGQAEAGTTVSVYDGTTLLGTTTVGSDGTWSYTPSELSNGDHSLTVTVTDAAGNVSPATTAFPITVDADLPPATSSLEVTDDTGSTLVVLADGASTHDNTPILSGLAGAGDSIIIYNGTTEIGTATADSSGQWQFDTTTLADGTYAFNATATDAVGNMANSGIITITIDTVAPAAADDLALNDDTGTTPVAIASGGETSDGTPVFSGTAEVGSTVTVLDGTTVLGTATVAADGTWSLTTPALTDGNHSLTTTVTDAAGNTSAASTPYTFTVDTQDPSAASNLVLNSDVTGVDVPITDGATNDTTPVLTGSAEAGTTVTIYDGTTLLGTTTVGTDGEWSFTTPVLTEGSHSLTTTVTDAAGNVSPASTAIPIDIDTTAPVAATDIVLSNDQSGVAVPITDGITNDSSPVLTGTAEAGTTVTIYDGTTSVGTVIAGSDGTWTYNLSALTEGAHSLTTTVTDAAGNVSPASTAIPLTVDVTPPAAAGDVTLSNGIGATIADDGATNDTTPVLTGTAEPGSTVTILDGTNQLGTAIVDSGGSWTFTTPALTEGPHSITTTVSDAAGNVSTASTAIDFTVDTTPPAVATDLQLSNDETGTAVPITDGITNDTTPVLTGTAEPGSTVTVSDNGVELGTATVATDGTWSFTPADALAEGSHSLTTTVTDEAGNVSNTSAAVAFTLDTTPPAELTNVVLNNDTGTTPIAITNGDSTNDTTPVISGTADAGTTVTISDGTTVLGSVVADSSGNWSFTTDTLSQGTHSLTATETDAAGNVSTPSTAINFIVDTTAPSAPTGLVISSDESGTPVAITNGFTNDTTPELSGTAEAGSTVSIYDADTGTLLATTTADATTGAWNITPTTALPEGTYNVGVTATDAAGNVSSEATISFTIDTTAPAEATGVEVDNNLGSTEVPITDGSSTNDATPVISGGAGSAEAGATVTVYDNGTTVLGTVTVAADGSWSLTTPTLTDGDHSLSTVVTDAAGNNSVATTPIAFTVDTTAPAAVNIVALNNDTSGTAVAIAAGGITNDSTPVLTGTAEANSTITISDGDTIVGTTTADATGAWSYTTSLTDGAHSLTATATDAAGNTSVASTAFVVTVDTIAPTVTDLALTNDSGTTPVAIPDGSLTNDNTPVLSGSAEAGSTITITDETGSATLTVGASGTWTYTPATPLTDGTHTLSVTATDAAGNVSAPATISLDVDATPPAAATGLILSTDNGTPVVTDTTGSSTSDSTPILSGAATAGDTVNIYNGTTLLGTTTVGSDGQWTLTLPQLADNTYTLSAQVQDAAGNVSTATDITVTVDTALPAEATLLVYNNDGTTEVPILNNATTNDNTPLVNGTATAGDLVTIYDADNNVLATIVASDTGTWTYQAPVLSDGTHSITITVTDDLGNVSPRTEPFTITVDTTAPEPVSNVLLQNNNGTTPETIANGGTTNDSTPLLSGTAEAGSTVSIYDADTGTLIATTAADATTGAWSITPTTALPDGTYDIGITSTDAAGNASAVTTLSFTVDTTAPAAIAAFNIYDNNGSTPVLLANDATTNDNTPLLRGTATAGTTVDIYQDGVLVGTSVVSDAGVWRYQSGTLTDSTYNYSVSVVDSAGNQSAQSPVQTVTIDTVAPSPVSDLVVTDNVGASQGDLASGDTTDDNTPTFSGTAEAGATVNLYEGTVLLGTAVADATTGAWTITPAALGNTTHDFTVSVTDVAGNVSTTTPFDLTIDAGVAPATSTLEVTDDSGTTVVQLADGDSTNDNTPVLSGVSTAGDLITIYDGTGNEIATVTVGTDGQWSYTPPAALADGAHAFFVTTTDAVGDVTTSDTINITIDTVAPAAVTNLTASNDITGTPVAIANGGSTNDNTPLLAGTAEAGSTVTIYEGTTVLGTTTADATTGAWSFDTPLLPNGTHSLSVTVTDEAGNVSPRSSSVTLTVDTIAPAAPTLTVVNDVTNTTVANGGSTNDSTPTLTGTAESGSTVTLYSGTTAVATTIATGGTWSLTPTTALADGTYTVTARSTDAAGNVSVASSSDTFTIDTVAPAAVTLVVSNDTGIAQVNIPNNGSTNDNTPVLSGTAEAGSKVTVSEGTAVLGTVTAAADGSWSFTTSALTDGSHTFSVTATDAAGNVSTAVTDTLTVITTGPSPVTNLTVTDNVGTITGPLVSGATTDDTTPTLSGTATAGDTVTIYDGTTVLGTVVAGTTGAWTFTTAALTNGSHPLSVTVTDGAGNVSAATNFPIIVDTVAPTAPTLVVTNDVTAQVIANGGSSNDSTPTLRGTAEANSTVKIYDNGTLLGTTTASSTGTWTYTTSVLAAGSHPFTVTATDAAGNVGAAISSTVIIDTTAPAAVTLTASNNDGSTPVAIANGGSTNDKTPALSGTAEAGSTVTIKDGTTVLGTTTAATNGTWSFTTGALADGSHTFSATATDAAGNVSTATTLTLTVDTVAPTASTLVVTNDNVTPNVTIPTGSTTNDSTPVLSGTAEANATVTVYDGTTVLGTTTASSTGAWSFTTSSLSNGTHPLSVKVTDAAGNISPSSTAVTVTVDTVAPTTPTLVVTNDVTDKVIASGGSTNDTTPTLTGTAEANSTVKIYDNGTLLGTTTASSTGTWSYVSSVLATGSHPLTVTSTDAAGNVSTAASSTVVIDTTAPAAVTVTAINNDGSSPVTIANNGTTNDNTPELTGTAEAGSTVNIYNGTVLLGTTTASSTGTWTFISSTLADGLHTLNVTATDAAGNVSPTTAVTFTIDTVAPAAITNLTVTDNVGSIQGTLTNGATTDDKTPTLAGTAEANATIEIYDGTTLLGTTTASGTGAWSYTTAALADGTHTLSVKAEDAAGNVSPSSSTFSITVDTVAPTATTNLAVNSTGTTLTGIGEAGDTVTVKDANGNTIGTGTVGTNGSFSVSLTTAETTGTTLSVIQTDLAGNVSPTATVTAAILIQATNDTTTLNYTEAEGTITNANTSATTSALLTVGLGGLLGASILSTGNSYQFTVDTGETRTITLHASLSGISLLADYNLYLYEKNANGTWSVVSSETVNNYLSTGLINLGTQTGANVTYTGLAAGTYAVVLGSPLNVALFPSTTITTTSDVSALEVTVAATVTGNLLTNDTSSVDGTVPSGTAVTTVSGGAVSSSGNTTITSSYGTLTIDAHGDYTYTLKAGLAVDTLPTTDSFTYSVRDSSGTVTSATLTIDLHEGTTTALTTNSLLATTTTTDADASGSVYGDSTATHSGTLSITNEEGSTTTVSSSGTTSITGDFGVLSVAANGHYTYTLNTDVNTQDITHKEVFSYSLASTDGTITSSSFTIDLHPTITPITGADTLTSSAYDDTITTGTNAETLVYHLLTSADATGGNGQDTWTDFSVSAGDKIDVSNLLIGWNDSTSNINDFVKVDHTSDGNTVLSIDRDGTGTAYSSTQLVTLEGVNASLEELVQQPHQHTTV